MSGHKDSAWRIAALDGIRGIAILLVMVCHFAPKGFPQTAMGNLLMRISEAGQCGVDLFFVLSGFLITGILYDAKNSPHYFRNFYMRRILRIFPLYYGMLIFFFGVLPHVRPFTPDMEAAAAHQGWLWCYGTNVYMAVKGDWFFHKDWLYLGHFWTLAIEEQFYLVWPLIVFVLPRRVLMLVCVGCGLLGVGLRTFLVMRGAVPIMVEIFTICRIDALAFGGLAALAVRGNATHLLRLARWSTLACGLMVLAVFLWRREWDVYDPIVATLGFSIFGLLCAGLLLWTVRSAPGSKLTRIFSHPALVGLGTYSYGLYVFHVPMTPLLRKIFAVERLSVALHSQYLGVAVHVILSIAASLLVAMLSWYLYEKQFLKFKKFFQMGRG